MRRLPVVAPLVSLVAFLAGAAGGGAWRRGPVVISRSTSLLRCGSSSGWWLATAVMVALVDVRPSRLRRRCRGGSRAEYRYVQRHRYQPAQRLLLGGAGSCRGRAVSLEARGVRRVAAGGRGRRRGGRFRSCCGPRPQPSDRPRPVSARRELSRTDRARAHRGSQRGRRVARPLGRGSRPRGLSCRRPDRPDRGHRMRPRARA